MIVGILLQFGSVGMTVYAGQIPVFWKRAVGSGLLKFLLSPALMLGLALAMGITGQPLYVCVLLAAMPTALYSVLIASLFGLNRDLANTTFILTHAVCLAAVAAAAALWYAGVFENV
jgi:predicted permease